MINNNVIKIHYRHELFLDICIVFEVLSLVFLIGHLRIVNFYVLFYNKIFINW